MNNFLFFLSFLLLSWNSYADIHLNHGSIQEQNFFETIPYEQTGIGMVVSVQIAGEKYRFIFDTGAPFAITETIYQKIKPKDIERLEVKDGVGTSFQTKIVEVSQVQLGELTFLNTHGIVLNEESEKMFACWQVDGIIGSNMLRNIIVQINSRSNEMILTDQSERLHLPAHFSEEMMLTQEQSSPVINIVLTDGEVGVGAAMLIDLGAQDIFCSLSLDNFKVAQEATNIFKEIAISEGGHVWSAAGMDNNEENILFEIPIVGFCNNGFEHVVTVTSGEGNSILGASLLDYAVLTLDYKNKKFYYDPFGDIQYPAMNPNPWGIAPSLENDQFVVGIIWDKKLEGVEIGDEIIKEGDQVYADLSLCELMKLRDQNPDPPQDEDENEMTIKSKRTGEIKKIKVKRM